MKVYGHPGSVNTQRVMLAIAEKGAEAELVSIELARGEHKSAEHLARHPFGVVPVLEDGDFSLCESRAIMRYIDERLHGPKLTPSSVRDRALMEQWISAEACYFSPLVMDIGMEMVIGKWMGRTPDMAKVEAARQKLGPVLDVLDKALAGRTYFVGNELTLADITFIPFVELLFASNSGHLVLARPSFNAWWNRVSERPTWRKLCGR